MNQPSANQKTSPLTKLFKKKQPKLKATAKKAAFLKQFAEEDHKRIAKLIQAWLEQDKKHNN